MSYPSDPNAGHTIEVKDRRYPIGPFVLQPTISREELYSHLAIIKGAPEKYRTITRALTKVDLAKTYREGSWNIQQLVTHVADMQLLHFFRMRKATTETDYKEVTLVNIDAWATSPDAITYPLADALDLMDHMTRRFVHLIESLEPAQLDITYYHPVRKITLDQRQAISMSSWHVRHHLEHIRLALHG